MPPTRYYLEVTCAAHGVSRDVPDTRFDALADAVHDLTEVLDVIDADVGADLAAGTVDVTMAVDADNAPDALGKGLAAVCRAIHAAGGTTPARFDLRWHYASGAEKSLRNEIKSLRDRRL